MMSGLLKIVDLDTHSKLGSLPTNRVLYEIDSYEWLSIYPKQLNHIENRFKILFRETFKF